MEYTVKIRRNLPIPVRPCAEQLDGRTYNFTVGWIIDDLQNYYGEIAMIPHDDTYPEGAPTWVASGDLIVKHP